MKTMTEASMLALIARESAIDGMGTCVKKGESIPAALKRVEANRKRRLKAPCPRKFPKLDRFMTTADYVRTYYALNDFKAEGVGRNGRTSFCTDAAADKFIDMEALGTRPIPLLDGPEVTEDEAANDATSDLLSYA